MTAMVIILAIILLAVAGLILLADVALAYVEDLDRQRVAQHADQVHRDLLAEKRWMNAEARRVAIELRALAGDGR